MNTIIQQAFTNEIRNIGLDHNPQSTMLQRISYMEYGLPPPGRVKPRRDGKMAKKQVHTMAKAEKVAPGSDWPIPLRTADAEVWLQENGRVDTVQKGA
jgi:hypothetical protein